VVTIGYDQHCGQLCLAVLLKLKLHKHCIETAAVTLTAPFATLLLAVVVVVVLVSESARCVSSSGGNEQ
jgi:hypothetical protein